VTKSLCAIAQFDIVFLNTVSFTEGVTLFMLSCY